MSTADLQKGAINGISISGEELVRLFKVAREHNPLHHIAMLVGLLHGLRISETLAIKGRDICDGKLSIKRLKKSR